MWRMWDGKENQRFWKTIIVGLSYNDLSLFELTYFKSLEKKMENRGYEVIQVGLYFFRLLFEFGSG